MTGHTEVSFIVEPVFKYIFLLENVFEDEVLIRESGNHWLLLFHYKLIAQIVKIGVFFNQREVTVHSSELAFWILSLVINTHDHNILIIWTQL